MQRLKTQFTLRDGQKEKSGRPKTVRTEANIQLVLNEISDKPNVSLRMVAQNLSLGYGSVQRICRKDLHLFPYKLVLVQALKEADFFFPANVSGEAYRDILQLFFFQSYQADFAPGDDCVLHAGWRSSPYCPADP